MPSASTSSSPPTNLPLELTENTKYWVYMFGLGPHPNSPSVTALTAHTRDSGKGFGTAQVLLEEKA